MAPPDDAACARFCDRSVMCSAVSIAVGSPISNLFRAGGFWLCQGSWGRMSAPHLDGPREATSGCVGLRRASSVPSGSTGQTCLSPPRWTCWASMGSFGLRRVPVGPAGQCGAFRPLSGSVGPRGAVWSVSDLVGIRRVPVGVRAGLRRAPSGPARLRVFSPARVPLMRTRAPWPTCSLGQSLLGSPPLVRGPRGPRSCARRPSVPSARGTFRKPRGWGLLRGGGPAAVKIPVKFCVKFFKSRF